MDDAKEPNGFSIHMLWERIYKSRMQRQKYNGRRNQVIPPDIIETMRGLGVEMQSYRENNERLIIVQEEHNQLNETMLQGLTGIQRNIKSRHHSKN